MYPRQRLYRAVNWALGLSVVAVAFVVFGFCTCAGTTTVVSAIEAAKIENQRPPATAPLAERDAFQERSLVVYDAAYGATGRAYLLAAVGVGIPTVLLLLVVSVLLWRVRKWIEQGV